jgi:sec-independent protein translocase protein TatC
MTDSDELLPAAATSVPRRALIPSPPAAQEPPGGVSRVPEPAPGDERVMSLVDHLTELRRRVAIAVFAIVVGTAIAFFFTQRIMVLLIDVLPGQRVQFLTVGGPFFLQLKIALILGVAMASPMILYQLWAFVSPGLTPRERAAARPWIPLVIVFFLLGTAVAYVTLPYAIQFLSGFQISDKAPLVPSAEAYFGFVTTLFLAFGAVMEFPIGLVLLSKLGILDVDRLRRSRRYVLLGIAIFAVVVTPGGDPVSPTVMGTVMYLLYEVTIILLSRNRRKASG